MNEFYITDEEKEEHKAEFETCGRYLKTLEYKEAWRLAWDKVGKKNTKNFLNCLTGTMKYSKR